MQNTYIDSTKWYRNCLLLNKSSSCTLKNANLTYTLMLKTLYSNIIYVQIFNSKPICQLSCEFARIRFIDFPFFSYAELKKKKLKQILISLNCIVNEIRQNTQFCNILVMVPQNIILMRNPKQFRSYISIVSKHQRKHP